MKKQTREDEISNDFNLTLRSGQFNVDAFNMLDVVETAMRFYMVTFKNGRAHLSPLTGQKMFVFALLVHAGLVVPVNWGSFTRFRRV